MRFFLFALFASVFIASLVVTCLNWNDYANVERHYQGVGQLGAGDALWLSSEFGGSSLVAIVSCVDSDTVQVAYNFSVRSVPEHLDTLGLSYEEKLVDGGAQIVLLTVVSISFVFVLWIAGFIGEKWYDR
jgi:hypothetical protein